MLSVSNTKIMQKNRYFSPQTTISKDWYVYAGHDNVYIRGYLKYPIFSDFKNINYFRNVFPINKSPSIQRFDWELYTGSLYDFSYLAIVSSHNFDSVFGYKLPTEVNFAYYDIPSKTLKTSLGDVYNHPINLYDLAVFDNKTLKDYTYCIVINGITLTWWDPRYEVIMYPLSYGIQIWFEFHNKTTIKIYDSSITGLPTEWEIPRPKYMLLYKGDFLTYNTTLGSLQEFVPSGSYLTQNELNTNGNTYTEITNIDSSVWNTIECEKVRLVSNGFLHGLYISNKLWIDNLDIQQFKRLYSKNSKNVWVYGEI